MSWDDEPTAKQMELIHDIEMTLLYEPPFEGETREEASEYIEEYMRDYQRARLRRNSGFFND